MTRHKAPAAGRYRGFVLLMLVVVYTVNFIDRQIVGILAVPIKAELGLSDTELGLLGGLAFALFYTGLGIPVAVLADRYSRTWIMTIALAVWSAMTALCGLAQNFWQLFVARLGVGVGEAGGVAPAYSLIADYFPPGQRARALGVYALAIPLGSALGMVLGGYIATTVDWRYAFFVVGIAGLVLAPVFRLSVLEPPRGALDGVGTLQPVSLRGVLGLLAGKRSFWLMSLGAATASIVGYGVFFWLPSLLVRSFGLTVWEAALSYGLIVLFGGSAGIWLGGWCADRLAAGRNRAYALVPAVAFGVTGPCYALAVSTSSLPVALAALLLPTAFGLAWLGPVTAGIQHIVPPSMRATASALFLFIINLVGIGLGTVLVGAISDWLEAFHGSESLRYSILAGSGLYVIASGLFFYAARYIGADQSAH